VNEIFYSIQGEGPNIGKPAIFIRLTGCNFRCSWCDTEYAFHEGTDMTEEQIVGECLKYPCKYVVLSGGEPLIQPVKQLIEQLWINGFKIDVETNGSIYKHLPWVETIVLSPKPPSSGMKTDLEPLRKFTEELSGPFKVFKVVVSNEEDFEYAVALHQKFPNTPFIFQLESKKEVDKKQADWLIQKVKMDPRIKRGLVDVRCLIQMQKIVWGVRRGV